MGVDSNLYHLWVDSLKKWQKVTLKVIQGHKDGQSFMDDNKQVG